jgi:hypothetical protein
VSLAAVDSFSGGEWCRWLQAGGLVVVDCFNEDVVEESVLEMKLVRDGNRSGLANTRPIAQRLSRIPYSYPRVNICTRTHTRQVSGTCRVYHSTCKKHIKITILMSTIQYIHFQN